MDNEMIEHPVVEQQQKVRQTQKPPMGSVTQPGQGAQPEAVIHLSPKPDGMMQDVARLQKASNRSTQLAADDVFKNVPSITKEEAIIQIEEHKQDTGE